jgi:chromate transporter
MLLPGPEAQQLATYIGWLVHKTAGGLLAGLLFILPGALVMLGLSIIYVLYSDLPIIDAAFLGIKAAVLVIVVEAVIRIGKRAITSNWMLAISTIAFIAIFFFSISFPIIIAVAALSGFAANTLYPVKTKTDPEEITTREKRNSLIERMELDGQLTHTYPSFPTSCFHKLNFFNDLVLPNCIAFSYLLNMEMFLFNKVYFLAN